MFEFTGAAFASTACLPTLQQCLQMNHLSTRLRVVNHAAVRPRSMPLRDCDSLCDQVEDVSDHHVTHATLSHMCSWTSAANIAVKWSCCYRLRGQTPGHRLRLHDAVCVEASGGHRWSAGSCRVVTAHAGLTHAVVMLTWRHDLTIRWQSTQRTGARRARLCCWNRETVASMQYRPIRSCYERVENCRWIRIAKSGAGRTYVTLRLESNSLSFAMLLHGLTTQLGHVA